MEPPTIDIEALCSYVEMDIENGVQINAEEWRQTINNVREWIKSGLTPRAADVCHVCGAKLPALTKTCVVCGTRG